MERRGFATDYTAFDAGGAAWLVAHRPHVQLVGIDYLTVATYADLSAPHEALLGKVGHPLNRAKLL
jgi:kynurenine formamidase